MKHRLVLSLGLLLAIGALAGCGKSAKNIDPSGSMNVGATSNAVAQAQVNDQVAANPQLVDEDVYETSSVTMVTPDGPAGLAAIRPLRWWRRIDNVSRSFTTDFTNPDSLGRPTMATVTIHKHLTGALVIVAGDTVATTATTPDSVRRIVKPLDDDWVRKLLLKRVRIDSTGTHAIWHIVGTSGAEVTSKGATTKIQSVRVQAGLTDTLITDPLELHRLPRAIHIADHTMVNITVDTSSPTDAVFLYHSDGRRRLHANGDGTYSIQFTTGDYPGLRHFAVDALSHGTLFDDQAPYDANAWIVPFAVRDLDRDIEHDNH